LTKSSREERGDDGLPHLGGGRDADDLHPFRSATADGPLTSTTRLRADGGSLSRTHLPGGGL